MHVERAQIHSMINVVAERRGEIWTQDYVFVWMSISCLQCLRLRIMYKDIGMMWSYAVSCRWYNEEFRVICNLEFRESAIFWSFEIRLLNLESQKIHSKADFIVNIIEFMISLFVYNSLNKDLLRHIYCVQEVSLWIFVWWCRSRLIEIICRVISRGVVSQRILDLFFIMSIF